MYPVAREGGLHIQDVGGEVVVYDTARQHVSRLNAVSALVWLHCDGSTSEQELAAIVRDKLNIERSLDAVQIALVELDKAHLLDHSADALSLDGRISRRSMFKRVAVAAVAGAIALPVVDSIVAQPPGAHATVPIPSNVNPNGMGNGANN